MKKITEQMTDLSKMTELVIMSKVSDRKVRENRLVRKGGEMNNTILLLSLIYSEILLIADE